MLKQRSLRLLLGTAAFLFLFPFIVFASVKIMEDPEEKRPDILTIDIPPSEYEGKAHKDMPPVLFRHDLHSRAVDGQCIKCHETQEGKPVFKFKRTEDEAGRDYMDLYHDNCVACHSEMKTESGRKGPLEAQCRTCHNAEPGIVSSRVKINFDRSLHFTHEQAKAVTSEIKTEETNCNACHHSANMKAKTVFYEKGKESACVYCHKPTAKGGLLENGIRSARTAAHDSCVACHLKLTQEKIQTGPVECAGCHDAGNQEKIKKHGDIPRLDRNQPDQVLITGWTELGSHIEENKKLITTHMNPVPFNHKAHEAKNLSCKTCHHQTLNKCSSCHTVTGQESGGFVKLSEAMHSNNASQSCLGCHNEIKTAKECAGCHAQMPQKAVKDQECAACHSVDVTLESQTRLKDPKATGTMAKASLEAKSYKRVNLEKIPEIVKIDTIAGEYQPSQFPHRMVVEAVFKKAGENGMAQAFHGSDLTMCAGCHHNSPPTMTPPQCASCHGKQPDIASGKPGLKGAYHGQCITCHQRMEVKNVLPTDCTKCHEKKAEKE